ncbi:MAG: VanZ family protein [Nitrospinae bacterium]|nr:VanZ family protein [Nitrospinota bacterium]
MKTYTKKYLIIWLWVGWGLVALIVYLSLMQMPPDVSDSGGDKVFHFIAYFTLMWWFAQVYIRSRGLLIALGCASLGTGLEFVQGFVGYRAYEYADILANCSGVLAAWWVSQKWSMFPKLKNLGGGLS